MATPSSLSSSMRAMVDLPAPLGLDRTKRRPRRWKAAAISMGASGSKRRPARRQGEGSMRYVALLRAVNVGGAQAADGRAARALRRARLGEGRDLHPERQCRVRGGGQAGRARDGARAGGREAIRLQPAGDRPHARQWAAYAAGNPFPEAERDEPNRLHARPGQGAGRGRRGRGCIEARGQAGERVRRGATRCGSIFRTAPARRS